MNEADLHILLRKGSHRLRLRAALRGALIALGSSALLLAAALFFARLYTSVPQEHAVRLQMTQVLLLSIPVLLTLLAWSITYFWVRPAELNVAHALDRAAGLPDHLVTWLELHAQKIEAPQAEFRAAQARDTLRRSEGLSPATLLPLRWPAWTPALWLVLIVLCSAFLVPPQIEVESNAVARARAHAARRGSAALVSQETQPAGVAQAPRVQPLSPTELWKLQLLASDPQLTAAQKKQLLDELQQKTGAIPESELTSDIRELLNQLREVQSDSRTAGADKPAGSTQNSSNTGAVETSQVRPAEGNSLTFRHRGLAQAESDFVDVKAELIRYYRGGTEQ